MIAFLQGKLTDANANRIVLDVHGVGYEVTVSTQSFHRLPGIGETMKILTYQHVREDMLALYGFLHERERDLFKLLMSVSGVGPKLAITILSGIGVDDFYNAVKDEDIARLSCIQGIGKKIAERLAVELKDKAVLLAPAALKGARVIGAGAKRDDATRALMALGYKQNQAQTAVEKVITKSDQRNRSIEELVKEALKLVGTS